MVNAVNGIVKNAQMDIAAIQMVNAVWVMNTVLQIVILNTAAVNSIMLDVGFIMEYSAQQGNAAVPLVIVVIVKSIALYIAILNIVYAVLMVTFQQMDIVVKLMGKDAQ